MPDIEYDSLGPSPGLADADLFMVKRGTGSEYDNPTALDIYNYVMTYVTPLLAAKAPLDSPIFLNNPTAPTQTTGNNSTRLATTAFVQGAISDLVAAAPGALNTLDELAAALGDDANFATTVTNALAGKVAKAGDTLSGDLTVAKTTPAINLNATGSNDDAVYKFSDGSVLRWAITRVGSSGALEIKRYDNTGTLEATVLSLASAGSITTDGTFVSPILDKPVFTRNIPLADSFDLNGLTSAGFYNVNTPVNGPLGTSEQWFVTVQAYDVNTNYIQQFAVQFSATPEAAVYVRNRNSGTWSSWARMASVTDVNAVASNLTTLQAIVERLSFKQSVRVASTADVTISSPGSTIDGISLAGNDRVLLKDQTTGAENGIYVWISAVAPMVRAADASTSAELEQAVITVDEGTEAGASFRQTAVNFTLGTDAVVWAPYGAGGGGSSAYASLTGIPAAIDALDGLTPAADQLPYFSGTNTAALTTITSAARSLLDDTTTSAMLTTLGAAPASDLTTLSGTVTALSALVENLAWKESARVGSTANVTISSPGATIDGISMVSGDRVLLKDQTAPAENGIYVWNGASSAMTRANDANFTVELEQAIIAVEEGTNAGTVFRQTAVNFTLGVGSVTWTAFGSGGTVAYSSLSSIPAAIDAIDGLTPAADRLAYYTSSSAAALATFTSFARTLLDDADAATMRTTLGLGSVATLSAIATANITDANVTNAKLANMAQNTIKGRVTASTGAPEDLSASQARSVLGLVTIATTGLSADATNAVNAQTGTTYTLVAGDNNKVVTLSNASAITVTVPNSLAVGFACTLVQLGAGQVTVAAGASAVQRNRNGHAKIAGQYGMAGIAVIANPGSAAEYVFAGDTSA